MNKKIFLKFLACFFSLSILLIDFAGCSLFDKPKEIEIVGKFKLEDYQPYIDFEKNSLNEIILGQVDSADKAKEKAKQVWIEMYPECINAGKHEPYKVFFDDETQVWLVEGSFFAKYGDRSKGGVPYILIQKSNGKVLAVWHTK